MTATTTREPTTAAVDPLEFDAAPTVRIGKKGKEKHYAILELTARQNRVVTPLIMSMTDVFIGAKMASDAGQAVGFKLTEPQYDVFIKMMSVGLSRAYPEMTVDKLLDEVIGTMDLISSVMVVAQQAGLLPEKVADPLASPPTAGSSEPAAEPTGTRLQ